MGDLKKVKTAVIGCGMISGIYLTNLTRLFSITDVVAVCDNRRESAEKAAKKYGIPMCESDGTCRTLQHNKAVS